jgi:maltooligosyltrehalose trehalohydrolase
MSGGVGFAPSWGARLVEDGRALFRVWAPDAEKLALRLADGDRAMQRDDGGWFEFEAQGIEAGAPYAYVLPDGFVVPDPASRRQQSDVNGPSLLCDPSSYRWQNTGWHGRAWEETVYYELHVGTFTPEGTFRSAIAKLPHLASLGITAIELMPIAQFGGDRGWGYDGTLLYSPHSAYGSPDDLKALVDAAHGLNVSVVLDVVYNHFGPDGNYLPKLAPDFFHAERMTPWGGAIAYEKRAVRDFFIENALYWLIEFRLDGLRLDAIDHIRDAAEPDILVELAQRVRKTFLDRPILLTTEDNRNITNLHERAPDGSTPLYSGEWNDDLHNAVHVLASGEIEAYYKDFADDPIAHVARVLAEGFAYQGEASHHAGGERRGFPSAHLPPSAFVDFIQNHDQVGNRALGERLISLTDEATLKALSAMLLLSPHIPLIFMGEEWGETNPFFFFTDFDGKLAEAVREGRRNEFAAFAAHQGADRDAIPDPNAPGTFEASKIDWAKAETPFGQAWRDWTRTLLALRQEHVAPALKTARGNAGRLLKAEENVIAVDWLLGDRLLEMRATFRSTRGTIPPITGQPIFRFPDSGTGENPGPSVLVAIGPAPESEGAA